MQQVGDIRREILAGERHEKYGVVLNNIGFLYSHLGEREKVEPLYLQALEINKRVYGRSHPGYLTGLNNLAMCNRERGTFRQAESYYREALELIEEMSGKQTAEYSAGCQQSWRDCTTKLARYDEAEVLLLVEVAEIRRKESGIKHPDYARSASTILASTMKKRGDYPRAEKILQQSRWR